MVAAGRPSVRFGSKIAKSGSIIAEDTPFFSSSPTVMIDTGVTSEPVPAVVGIKTKGNVVLLHLQLPRLFLNLH